MSHHPFISIIIAVYNAQPTLARCLDSIIHQSNPDWELIVIDGGSTDGTVEILTAYQEHLSHWISEPDHGIYHAWNKALQQVSGEWVIFLGADDYLATPDVLERMVPHLQKALPESRVVYGQVAQVDRSGEVIRVLGEPWEKISGTFLDYMKIPHPASFQHRELFVDHGNFCEEFSIAGDYEFLLRELPAHSACFAPDVVVTAMQIGGASATPENNFKMLQECQRARKMRGVTRSTFYYPLAHVKNFLRLALERIFGRPLVNRMLDAWRLLTGRRPYWTKL